MSVVTTNKARELFAKAHATGSVVPKITQVGWGDGGHDVNNSVKAPSASATITTGEFLKKNIDEISNPTNTSTLIKVSLQYAEGNGKLVSACGLYDAAGNLIALKHFIPKGKDNETVIEIDWTEQF